MTQQHLDTITIGGQNHWLAREAPILPPDHGERIDLELRSESTANYKGWDAHWKIEEGRLWLAELSVFGFLGRSKSKRYEECADGEEYRAVLIAFGTPRRISFKEIFGVDPPVFASWVTRTLMAVSMADDTQYRRDDAVGISGAFTRVVTVENGSVISDETVPDPAWDLDRSEHRRREAERARAMQAAEDHWRNRKADTHHSER